MSNDNATTKKNISHTKNLAWVTFANLLARIMFFASSIIVARYLFPEDFGIISMALTITSIIDCSSQFGVESFYLYRQKLKEHQVNTIFWINLIVAAIFSIIMIAGSIPASIIYKTPELTTILLIAGFAFFITRLGNTYRMLLLKNMRGDLISKIDIITNLANSVLIMILAVLGFKYLCYVIPTLISQIIMASLYFHFSKWNFSKKFDTNIAKELLTYSKSYMPQALLSYFIDKTDYVMIGFFLGTSILGYYYFGFEKAILLIIMIKSVLLTVYYPIFAYLQRDTQELNEKFISLSMKISYLVYPLIFGMIILAPEFLNLLFGSKWNNSVFTFQLICGYAFFKLISDLIVVIFNATGNPQQNLRHYMLLAPIFVITYYFIPQLTDLNGIAIASFAIQTIASVILIFRYCKFFKQSFFYTISFPAKILLLLLLQAIILIPCKIFLYSINSNMIFVFVSITLLSVIIYYFQTRLFLNNMYLKFLIPYFQKFILKFNKIRGQKIET